MLNNVLYMAVQIQVGFSTTWKTTQLKWESKITCISSSIGIRLRTLLFLKQALYLPFLAFH